LQKNIPKPDFAHDGKAATLLEKMSILDHVCVYLGAHWFGFFELSLISVFVSAAYKVCEQKANYQSAKDAKFSALLSFF